MTHGAFHWMLPQHIVAGQAELGGVLRFPPGRQVGRQERSIPGKDTSDCQLHTDCNYNGLYTVEIIFGLYTFLSNGFVNAVIYRIILFGFANHQGNGAVIATAHYLS